MSRSPSAVLLSFPSRAVAPKSPVSRAVIDRAVGRGRALQAEALRAGFARAFRFLVGGCSLRVLRVPGGQRQPCC